MTARHGSTPDHGTPVSTEGIDWRGITEWISGIIGGIAVFLGLFVLFAGEDHYVGIGGDVSWRVGDISLWWAYGLLIGGLVLLAIVVVLVLQGRRRRRA